MNQAPPTPHKWGEYAYRTSRVVGDRVRGIVSHVERQKELRAVPTSAEYALWQFLRAKQFHGKKFRRQHGIGPYIVDFYCDEVKLIIEVDGSVHDTSEAVEYDYERDQYFFELGYRVLHVRNDEVLQSSREVLVKIERMLDVTLPIYGELEGHSL